MIGTKYPTDAFADAVQATAYIARVHLQHGELMLPQRIREHIADGDVVVHLVRGEDDVAVCRATLTSRSTLTGVAWPEDIAPGMSVTVMCPRGAVGHDIAVALPLLAEPLHAAVEPEPAAEPLCTCTPEWCYVGDDVPDTALASECRVCVWRSEADGCPARIESEEAALLDEPEDDVAVSGELPDPWTVPVSWPGDIDVAAAETTEVFDRVADTDQIGPEYAHALANVLAADEPGTVFSAALVDARSQALIARQQPPRPAGWLERRVRLGARLVLDRSRAATRVLVAAVTGLVLAGGGLGSLVTWAVTR